VNKNSNYSNNQPREEHHIRTLIDFQTRSSSSRFRKQWYANSTPNSSQYAVNWGNSRRRAPSAERLQTAPTSCAYDMTTVSSAIPTHGNYHNLPWVCDPYITLNKIITCLQGIAITTRADTTRALRSYHVNSSPTHALQ
jgi:hypothetical protein